ncbi:hypothetical protein QBC46DRAFT_420016 [Diplogelasinospora grovesii]|uniref:Uncharacterized protein n=1 Tax=Diplogelasinospora grovesii TaxID=303347 RepID=A0AAN6ND32_9PEZI|nr:hypothetical protein QBC46DRAFT_420016 [Diplogelasinospora grovesii]
MDQLDPSRIERYRQELRDEETPEPEPLEAQELHDVWQQGSRRRPVPPKLSDRHKADLVDLKRRWIAFAAKMGHRDWKGLIKILSYENKGLGESFMRCLMRQAELQGNPIKSENAIRVHTRKLGGLYRKYYNARPPERSLMDHLRNVVRSEITRKWALRREPKIKPIMGPDFFMYHLYFLWPKDLTTKVKEYDEESDAYTDVECSTDKNTKPRAQGPLLCPIAHILAKALAEGVITNEGYQTRAEPFFTTRLNKRALKIRWKKEWLHKPVSRKTDLRKNVEKKVEKEIRPATLRDALFGEEVKDKEVYRVVLNSGGGSDLWEKSDDALTAAIFDTPSSRTPSWVGTQSPYLAIFNHMGLRLDENAPKRVPDEMMRMIGPSAAVRRLEQEMEALQGALEQNIKAQLSTARQKQRRKVFRKTYKDYFTESDDKELQPTNGGAASCTFSQTCLVRMY